MSLKESFEENKKRSILKESIRMLKANLNFTFFYNKEINNVVIVTSSIKGEGKTMVSAFLSKSISDENKKVLLIGCDLRNPQLHKFIGVDKNIQEFLIISQEMI